MDARALLQTILSDRQPGVIPAPDGLLIVDNDGCILFANAAATKIFSRNGRQLNGASVESFIPALALIRTLAQCTNTSMQLCSGASRAAVGVADDGTAFPVLMSVCPLQDKSCTVVADIRDLSTNLEASDSPRTTTTAGQERSSYQHGLRNTAHELRTPLGAMVAYANLLLMRMSGPLTSQQTSHVNIIKNTGMRLLTLLNDLVDIGKADAGAIEPHWAPESCIAIVREVADMLRPLADGKGLGLVVTVPTGELMLVTDRMRMIQILTNLVGNAIKFTDHGSVDIVLEAGLDNDRRWVEVRIIDSGCGINQDDVPKLFQEFLQVGGLPMHRTSGAGLGLYLSQQLAGILGGDIRCESMSGTGSTFTLRIFEERRHPDGGERNDSPPLEAMSRHEPS